MPDKFSKQTTININDLVRHRYSLILETKMSSVFPNTTHIPTKLIA